MNIRFDERDRDSVLRDLDSSDEEVRRLAVERVEAVGMDAAVPLLVRRLEAAAAEGEDEVLALTEALIALARGDADVADRVVDLLGGRVEGAPEGRSPRDRAGARGHRPSPGCLADRAAASGPGCAGAAGSRRSRGASRSGDGGGAAAAGAG